MRHRLVALLAIFSLCTLLALPSAALAGPKNDEADDLADISISIDGIVRAHPNSHYSLFVLVTFVCAVTGSFEVEAQATQGNVEAPGDVSGHCRAGTTISPTVRFDPEGRVFFVPGPVAVFAAVTNGRVSDHTGTTLILD